MLLFVEVILKPFFRFFLHWLEGIILDFIFRGEDKLLFNVILFGKSVEPETAPGVADVSNHGKITFFES